jgi:glutathione S-transferase
MILVGQYDSPFVRRVAITLHQYGLPFQRNTMSVFADGMAQINPLVRIPSLVLDDGETLVDSACGWRSPAGDAAHRDCGRHGR